MKEYDVELRLTLRATIRVEADSAEDAESMPDCLSSVELVEYVTAADYAVEDYEVECVNVLSPLERLAEQAE